MDDKNTPIIVFGTGRSGTTIFMEALFRHPKLAFFSNYLEKNPRLKHLNYLRYFYDNRFFRVFGRKRQINDYNYLEKFAFKSSEGYPVWDFLLGKEDSFSRSFLFEKLADENTKNKIRDYISDLVSKQGRDYFAVKITGPGRLRYLHSIYPNAKFIYLKRSFLPVLSSFLKVSFWKDRSSILWWNGAYTEKEIKFFEKIKNNPTLSTAFQLKKILEINEKEISELNINVKVIDYEEFVENPKVILSEALDFCGLQPDKECFSYLAKNELVNRNKNPSEYFDVDTLNEIENILR